MASLLRWSFSSLLLRGATRWRALSADTSSNVIKTSGSQEVVEHVSPDELVCVSELSGVPEEQLRSRVARIFVPSRHAMQSGSANVQCWKLEFDTKERWENPLMGWASTADPLSALSMEFDSQEEAIAFAVKNGWSYQVQEPKTGSLRPKSYAANFSWDKKTRIVTK